MCGIYGMISEGEVRDTLLEGISLLQHRGQEGSGILVLNQRKGTHFHERSLGGPSTIQNLEGITGQSGVAHVRYRTTGTATITDNQPFWTDECRAGLAHNGQVVNMDQLRDMLARNGNEVTTNSDGELLLRTFAHMLGKRVGTLEDRIFGAVEDTQRAAMGGYAVIMPLYNAGLLAFRDPWGIRPLVMGVRRERGNASFAFASESAALELTGFTDIKDLTHGEAVLVRPDLTVERKVLEQRERKNCGFEYFYFGDASSTMEGMSINHVRYEMGKVLARKTDGLALDIVVPIPETPRPVARGFSHESGVPYADPIFKYRGVGRIYITPDQAARERKARQGLRLLGEAFDGKDVMLIDDSIVRGTNMREVVQRVREAGARSIHVGIAWPPIIARCPYGIDMTDRLFAEGRTHEQMRDYLGADTLTFASIGDVKDVLGHEGFCTRCISGNYETPRRSALMP